MLLLFAKIFCLDIEVHNLNEFKFRTNLVDRNGILTRLEKAAGRWEFDLLSSFLKVTNMSTSFSFTPKLRRQSKDLLVSLS